jgi:hypothetical protein
VSRTRIGDEECVTRVLLSTQVPPALGPLVQKIVLQGHGTMLGMIPEDLQLTLEGYRVAARLPTDAARPWTHAVAAGVDANGHVYVTTRWIEGTPLHHVPPGPPDEARRFAIEALRILALLHARLVTYGDFKSENLVLRPDSHVALIDLDTLREVAGPVSYAPTRDLTRSWAAPEQEREQQTFLASDLWAWARFVETRFVDGSPPEWRTALDACRLGDPLRRPRTDVLLAHLEGGGADALVDWLDRPTPPASTHTERVPESPTGPVAPPLFETVRVPESREHTGDLPGDLPGGRTSPTLSPVTGPLPVAPPRKKRTTGYGCLQAFLVAVALPILSCAGLWFAWDRVQIARADEAAQETMVALEAYKTRPEINRQKGQREYLERLADDAWEIRHTPTSSAVRALATVWAQGWQDSGRTWSADRYQAGENALSMVEGENLPEALLARATLEAGACRLHRLDATAPVHCARSLATLATFGDKLPAGDDANWLRVEGAWTAVLVESELAATATAARLPDAGAHLSAGLERCVAAEPWLPYAPVNGVELLQDCLRLAGASDALGQYRHWADLLVAADRSDGAVTPATLGHLYTAAGSGCDAVTLDKRRGDWLVRGGTPWCVAVGHAARHCWASAVAASRDRDSDPAHPWAAFDALLASPEPETACVR